MNKERIEAAIKLMEDAKNLDMRLYQGCENWVKSLCTSVEQLHECGNSACFAGYLAVSKEFREAGGSSSNLTGAPYFGSEFGPGAVAKYLDISARLALSFVHGDLNDSGSWSHFYKKFWKNVSPQDVIEKLNLVLKGELE